MMLREWVQFIQSAADEAQARARVDLVNKEFANDPAMGGFELELGIGEAWRELCVHVTVGALGPGVVC